MRVNKAKPSQYDTVNTENLLRYINEYVISIQSAITKNQLQNLDRAKLKSIAAELETVCKTINAGNGIY